MKYKGIIFDFDGTLANTLEDIADSMNFVLASENFPIHPLKNYKGFVGNGLRNLVSQSLPADKRSEDQIEKCYRLMLANYQENCLVKTKLYDGMEDVVEKFEKMGYKLAVFSNKAHRLTLKIVNAMFTKEPFDIVLGAKTNFPSKPDPSGALLISSQWNILPHDIAYVGDSDVDMLTANNAGMFAIGVTWGYRDRDDLHRCGAKVIVEKPLGLLDILSY